MKLKYNGIKALLARREMTQTDLADKIGVHRNTVASWLNGSRSANMESVVQMLAAMGYTDDEIFNMRLGDLLRIDEDQ